MKYGINVNYLTNNTHRDPLRTSFYRFVPCRIKKPKVDVAAERP